jgi:hypothetical protein
MEAMALARAARGLAAVGFGMALGCTPGALDSRDDSPRGGTTGQGGAGGTTGVAGAPGEDLVTTLKGLVGPGTQLIVATNGGVVTRAAYGPIPTFPDRDPETLVEAAAVVGMPVCSVEPLALAFASATSTAAELSTPDAQAMCVNDDLGDMLGRLSSLKTEATVVVVAANTAITVHSANNGINYFYDLDIGRLQRAARRLYVPVCIVSPDVLALPSPGGQLPGLSIEDALASCGRS